VRALDEALALYIARLLDCLRSLRPVCGLAQGDRPSRGQGQGQPSLSPQQQGPGSESGTPGETGGLALGWAPSWRRRSGPSSRAPSSFSPSPSAWARAGSMFEASLRASISRLADNSSPWSTYPPRPIQTANRGRPLLRASLWGLCRADPRPAPVLRARAGGSLRTGGQNEGSSLAALEARLVAYIEASTAVGLSSPSGHSSLASSGSPTPDVDMALVRLASMPEKLQRLKGEKDRFYY